MTRNETLPEKGKSRSLSLPPEDLQWWRDARFGLFIHWGVYAIPGRGEWLMWNERIPFHEYAGLADRFKPLKFDGDAWAEAARAAGAKYAVLTARHHDGFCLFDSRVSDFTSVKTAAGRDFVAEYVEACRRAGLRVGLYYSPLDWRFPGFFFPNLYRESAEAMKQQTYDQVRELLTNYGRIDILWFDGGGDDWLGFGGIEWTGSGWRSRDSDWPQKEHYGGHPLWEPEKLVAMVRQLQPHVVVNDRSGWEGDFATPERKIGAFDTGRPWETCDCLAGSWGWMPDSPMLSLRSVVQLLVRVMTGDGNLLLNVGPTGDGEIEPRQVRRLEQVGEWLSAYGHSVYGTRGGPFPPQPWGGYTHCENLLYVHVLDWPEDHVMVPVEKRNVVDVRPLTSARVEAAETGDGLCLGVPPADRQAIDTIIELEMANPDLSPGRVRDQPR